MPGSGEGRFNRVGQAAVYLADSAPTAWAEWYRWLAEWAQQPADRVPRDLHTVGVDLSEVADLRTEKARRLLGLPRMRQTSQQWPAFQAVGDRLRGEGAEGVLYSSCARTRSTCLCVFAKGVPGLSVEGRPVRVITPPPPPRGMRT